MHSVHNNVQMFNTIEQYTSTYRYSILLNSAFKRVFNNYFTINSFACVHTIPQQIISVSFQPKFNSMKNRRFQESFMYINLSCVSKESLTSFFLVCTPFNSIICYIIPPKTSSILCRRRGDKLVFFLIQWKFFEVLSVQDDVRCGFSICCLYYIELCPGYPYTLNYVFQKW